MTVGSVCKRMPRRSRSTNTPAICGTLGIEGGFLLDDGRENQRLVGTGERQILGPRFPGRLQLLLHASERHAEQLDVGGVARESIGVWEELPFGMQTGLAERTHDVFGRARGVVASHVRRLRQDLADVGEGRAFDEGDAMEQDLARVEQVQQRARREAGRQLIFAGLQRVIALGDARPRGEDQAADRASC